MALQHFLFVGFALLDPYVFVQLRISFIFLVNLIKMGLLAAIFARFLTCALRFLLFFFSFPLFFSTIFIVLSLRDERDYLKWFLLPPFVFSFYVLHLVLILSWRQGRKEPHILRILLIKYFFYGFCYYLGLIRGKKNLNWSTYPPASHAKTSLLTILSLSKKGSKGLLNWKVFLQKISLYSSILRIILAKA